MSDNLLTPEQRRQLETFLEADIDPGLGRRAQLLLLYDTGQPTRQVAQAVGLSRSRTRYWRRQFQKLGMQVVTQEVAVPVDGSEPDENKPLQVDPAPVQVDPAPTQIDLALADAKTKKAKDTLTLPASQDLISAKLKLKSPGIEAADPIAEAGRKTLRYHFMQMLRHEEGTRLGADIEELHDMRVATRRMRAAFEVFEIAFTPKTIKTHLKGLKAAGRALGGVRDLDVFMENAQHYMDTVSEAHHQGLFPLLNSWSQSREQARLEMLAYLDSKSYTEFTRAFDEFVNTPGAGANLPVGTNPVPDLVCEIAPELIYTRFASVRAYDSILDSATLEQLHALRIEFKKLRYTLEFFREVLGSEAGWVIDQIKMLQDHLGELNDAQVATQILREFLTDWDTQQDALPVSERVTPEPIMAYLSDRYQERQRLMSTFPDAWRHFNRPEFRQNLAQAVAVL